MVIKTFPFADAKQRYDLSVWIQLLCYVCVVMVISGDTSGLLLDSTSVGGLSNGQTSVISGGSKARLVFNLSDFNNDSALTLVEMRKVFSDFDSNGDGNVTASEFFALWRTERLGGMPDSLRLFLNLDVNKDFVIEAHDMPYIFKFFDRDEDGNISEEEFVTQWLKLSK